MTISSLKITLASINHVSAYYGGNEHYLHHLAMGLHEAGHHVTYLAATAHPTAEYSYEIRQIPVHLFVGNALPSLAWGTFLGHTRPEIFHTSGSGFPLVSAAMMAKHRYLIPTVHTYQAPTNPVTAIASVGAILEQNLIPRAYDAIIATSPVLAEELKERWQFASTAYIPMMLAPHFFNRRPSRTAALKKYQVSPDRPTILFIGQLDDYHYYKDLDTLINTIPQLPREYLLLIAGNGNRRPHYERLIEKLQIQNQCQFLGHIDNQHIRELYTLADVFVLPSNSNSEGFGLVLLEAMSMQVPTITTTAIACAPWFARHRVTTLIPPGDPIALSHAILNQAEHPDTELITRAKNFANNYTPEAMVKETLAQYELLLSHA